MKLLLDYAGPLPKQGRAGPSSGRNGLGDLFGRLIMGALVGIIGFIILAILTPTFNSGHGDPRLAFAKRDIANYSTTVDAFAADVGRYPTDAEGLAALASKPNDLPGWKGPYLIAIKPDPWGHPYVYQRGGPSGGPGYRIVCTGPDGREGTEDDIDGGSDEAAPVRNASAALPPPSERQMATCAAAANRSETH